MNNNTPTTMSLYTEALAARSAALAAGLAVNTRSRNGDASCAEWSTAAAAYDTACAEVEAIEEAMERAL